jgi:quercetin dioxygenase-like cupin family protein
MVRPMHSSRDVTPLRISAAGDLYTILVSGDETGGAYAVVHAVVPPGSGPPPHVHSRDEEGFYVLSGEVTITADGATTTAGPGTQLNLPVGSVHFFKNETTQPAEMLITVVPSGFEKFLEEFGTILTDPHAGPLPVTHAEIARLMAAAPKYGIEVRVPH